MLCDHLSIKVHINGMIILFFKSICVYNVPYMILNIGENGQKEVVPGYKNRVVQGKTWKSGPGCA